MQKRLIQLEFYETYYYVNIISNVISDPYPYIRNIHEWYEDAEAEVFLPAFPKFSRLHGFSTHLINSLIDEEISDITVDSVVNDSSHNLWVDNALKYHGFQCDGFRSWIKAQGVSIEDINEDHIYDYHQELMLAGEMENLVERLANETFHVLFSNRKVLAMFNEFMARNLQLFFDGDPVRHDALKAPGVLKRVNIPTWVKRAVFYRDRGMCSSCHKDLSGTISTQPDPQYDHIIPLAAGGLNDITNIQLLCQTCNASKSKDLLPTSTFYESWY